MEWETMTLIISACMLATHCIEYSFVSNCPLILEALLVHLHVYSNHWSHTSKVSMYLCVMTIYLPYHLQQILYSLKYCSIIAWMFHIYKQHHMTLLYSSMLVTILTYKMISLLSDSKIQTTCMLHSFC